MSRPVRCALVALASLSFLPVAEAAAQRGGDVIPDRYIVLYERSVDQPEQETEQRERDLGFKSARRYRRAVVGFAAKLSDRQVDSLEGDPEVDAVVPDRRVHATADLAPNDTAPSGVLRMGAATSTTVRGRASTNVAVVDTGIAPHPDLNVGEGTACIGTGTNDGDGHGTHVAGSIAAENDGSGVVGVAPGTRVHPVKVLDDSGSGTTSSVVCGIDWVAANASRLGIRVANMSLGGGGPRLATCATTTDPEHRAICRATNDAGVTFVVAAGNDGWDFDYAAQPDIPAVYPEVLTVTAVSDSDGRGGALGGAPTCRSGEADDRYASFSNFATTSTAMAHTIAAPGVCITSTFPGGHGTMSGTSMASPHVAGAAALCIGEGGAAGPCATLTPAQIISRMRSDAQGATTSANGFGFAGDPLRPVSGRFYGYMTAGAAGGSTTSPPPSPTTSPTAMDVAPVTIARISGAMAGSAQGLAAASDGTAVTVDSTTSGTRTSAFDATYQGVPATLSELKVAFRGGSSRGCSHTLAVRDTNGSWVTVDSRTLSSTLSVTTGVISDPARFVDASGNLRVRVRCTLGNRSFRTTTDLLRIRYLQPAS